MEQSVEMYEMFLQQNISPAANASANAVDWLPLFAGFSWLAYGAHFSVVISMAPSPSNTGEVAMGGFFRQVLSTSGPRDGENEKEFVSCVSWAPRGPSIGSLAAAAGKNIYLYLPKGLNYVEEANQNYPELPLRWVESKVLEHFSNILSFAWSESGDGLLSVGQEIVMWQKDGNSWNCLWRSQLERPQSLSAASWSARGIAATAEGASSTAAGKDDADHLVKIWWWEDGKELQEVELSHPHQLLMIQWRPMTGFGSGSQSFRPVLLTCCRDGVVRLWAEIGNLGFPPSGNSSLSNCNPSTALDKVEDGFENQCKLAFFVSAVIDVNSTLKGVLGKNIHITWPEGRGVGSSNSDTDECSSLVNKESDAAVNEWLIGIGPLGSITLWSVQSLDDLSPARGPLVQLWHQRPGLLPTPSLPSLGDNVGIEAQSSPRGVKVVVHRPHRVLWGPPSSLDVFETWSPDLLRWSCIWPPVAAIGGPSSKSIAANSGVANMAAAGGKMSAWGVSSEIVVLGGHDGNIIQVAVHPIAVVKLVASLDSHGTILLWDSNGSSFNPRLEMSGCLNPLWKLCGRLIDHQHNCAGLFSAMAWAPVVFPGHDTVLLLGHSHGIDCLLMSRKVNVSRGKPKSSSISHSLLYTIDWPLSADGHGFQGIYIVASHLAVNDDPHIRSCIAVGVGGNGIKLASWKLDFELQSKTKERHLSSQDLPESAVLEELIVYEDPTKSSVTLGRENVPLDDVVSYDIAEPVDSETQHIQVDDRLLGILTMCTGEQVTSIAVSTSEHMSGRHFKSLSNFTEGCDIVTGCADGVLRLWKVWDGIGLNQRPSLEEAVGFQCVGLLRCYSGPVTKVALCSSSSKIASIANSPLETSEIIHIWGADTFMEERGYCLEGRIRLQSAVVSLSWLDGANGSSILGVTRKSEVQLFAECREGILQSCQGSDPGFSERNAWTCLASSSLKGFSASSLLWEAQGSLIVTCGGHMLLYSNCVLPVTSSTLAAASLGARQSLSSGNGQSSNARGISSYEAFFVQGHGTFIQGAVRLHGDDNDFQETRFCSILEAADSIGSPLLDYHPESLLCWITGGSRQNARASIRHLASYLISLSSPATGVHKNGIVAKYRKFNPKVSRTPLSNIFQEKEQFYLLQGQHPSSSFMSGESRQKKIQNVSETFSTPSKPSFVDLTSSLNIDYREKDLGLVTEPNLVVKRGGNEPCTRVEVEVISNAVRDSLKIPGLSGDKKLQLLAIIDVLSEMDGDGQPSQIDSLDLPGQRFWVAFRYSVHHARWKNDGSDIKMPVMDSKAMAWALQSEFKENLLDLCLSDQSISWSAMRALGVGYWFTDGTELRKKMEKLARAQYLAKKDPKDCALLYLALDRRSVLAGLFKLSRDQGDRPIADFLLRDFKDEKNKVAALKNAYVLMGKHRHELAATFFILGGDIKSAGVVCAKNLGDTQLALVISSLLEGVSGPIGQEIILKYTLSMARESGDGWLASLLQWLLGDGVASIQELSLSRKITTDLDGSKTLPMFPLDVHIGSYCELLASKPRVRMGGGAAEASAMARIACARSFAALKRSGLSLQALEYLRGAGSVNMTKLGSELNYEMFHDGGSFTGSGPLASISDIPLMDVNGRQVGSGWVSAEVVAGIWKATRFSLVLQCASQLLQDHPQWGGQACSAWQGAEISKILAKQEENSKNIGSFIAHRGEGTASDICAKKNDMSTYLERADKLYDDDLQLLTRKYLVKVDRVAAALSTFSRIHHRAYLLHRLVHGLWSFAEAPKMGFHLANQSAVSVSAARCLKTLGTEAPHVLAWTVLSCGGAAATQEISNLDASKPNERKTYSGSHIAAQDGALPEFSFEELVRFGGEIQLLAKAAGHESPLFGKERGKQAMSLLSFIFFVAAAWLGRQTKSLFALIEPTVVDPSTAPEVPPGELDAVLWFRSLELGKGPIYGRGPGKKLVEPVGFNMAGTVTISGDDAWRVLGMSLWTHLLIYVRKQLTGMASEAVYSAFGRISSSQSQNSLKSSIQGGSLQPQSSMTSNLKGTTFFGFNLPSSAVPSTWLDFKSRVRDSYQTHNYVTVASHGSGSADGRRNMDKLPRHDKSLASTTDTDDFEAALLSSLTSIVAGLRKQLAAHLDHPLDKSDPDPLTLWLWGKPGSTSAKQLSGGGNTLNFFSASSSNGPVRLPPSSSATVVSQSQPAMFPTAVIGMEDKVWMGLWELLVVREKVCSALGLEGVSGQRRKVENSNVSGWYIGRKGSVLAAKIESAGSARGVNTNGKLPPKRIMWNAVKDVPAVSDQGVTLSSRREEQNFQSRSQASEDGLHLSEEFSEAHLEDPLTTI